MNLSLLIFLFFIISSTVLCNSQDAYMDINETYSNQIALNIYIDESGKALITGYIENPEVLAELEFLRDVQYTFDSETHQLVCLTDRLTSKQAEVWKINLTITGYFTEFSATIYFPQAAKVSGIEISRDLNYYIVAEDESVAVEIQGFDINDPSLALNYKLMPSQPSEIEKYEVLIISLIISCALIFIFALALWKWRAKETIKADIREEEKEIVLTPEMQKVIETLNENERQIVNVLLKYNGKLTQAKIRHETGIPKSSLTGIINALERKKIINKIKYGRTNVIELSSWFLGKNKPK
ncbi:MAG: winged helix-turn-helix transcriptional regulator [Methanocellales archaeon]